jgi:hypothetical protein
MGEGLLGSVEAMKALEKRLERCPAVARYGKDEAMSLAYNLAELEQSMQTLLREQLPKLVDPKVEGEELADLLVEIRVDLQHILYHIHDPRFFRVVEPTHDWLALSEDGGKAQER